MFLQLKDVGFSYGHNTDKKVLSGISFSIEKGRTLAIVGASGSGKSTILRLIAGILPIQDDKATGEILIDGKTPSNYLKEGKLSFMFQKPALFPNLTVRENIELPLKINQDAIGAEKLIEAVGLKEYQNYLPKRLSGGMKTRVSLARSFVTNPELLLLDEPFSSLDVAWKDFLYSELNQLKKNLNTTVVLVTHDIEEAIRLADNIVCLGINGQIIFEKNNTQGAELYSQIETLIIDDHKLRKEYEKSL
jgi:NitT/TauT family transport system ATP-binding protein